MSSFPLPSVTVTSRSHLYNNHHHHHDHHLSTLFTTFFLLFFTSPCHAYSSGGSGLPVFIKLIFIFFGVLFLVVFLIIIRRILAMRRIAANGGGVVHYQNAQPTAQIVVQARHRPRPPPPPNGFVTTISTGNVTTQAYQPSNSQIGFVYPQPVDNGQMILSSQAFSPESVYFPAPHQSPPAPGFTLPGAPPPYYPVAPPDHQSYSK